MIRAFLFVLVAAASFTSAGSYANPEILDSIEPIEVQTMGSLNVAIPEIDIERVWLSVDDGSVIVNWKIANLSRQTLPDLDATYKLTYRDDRYALAIVDARRSGVDWTFTWRALVTTSTAGEFASLSGGIDGDVIWAKVPQEDVHGHMTHLVASSLALLRDGEGGSSGGGNVWARDRAPDSSYGRDFDPGAGESCCSR